MKLLLKLLNKILQAFRKGEPMKRALCVAINDYPGTAQDLSGCVRDCKTMSNTLLNTFGISEQVKLLNNRATRKNILAELAELVKKTLKGEWLVFYYSGHGTWVPDVSGDEPDGRDEALYVYGRRKKDRILLDDDLRAVIDGLAPGANLLVISDSCHSGSVTRALADMDEGVVPTKKYVAPEGIKDVPSKVAKHFGTPDAKSPINHILISGCSPTQYSYEAVIGNAVRGVFTHRLINVLKKNPKATIGKIYQVLRTKLPSAKFAQTPQLDCKPEDKKTRIFQ